MYGIYALLNLVNGMIYVGSAKDFYKRWCIHKCMLNGDYHDNSHLQRAWNKYGAINFMFIIIEVTNKLEEREQFWIDETKCYDRKIGYNKRLLATNNSGLKHSLSTKLKIAIKQTGKIASKETRQLQSKNSANRNKEKWPHELGAKCKCEECKTKWKTRDRTHMQEWRASNREAYNSYMRDYNRKRKLNVVNVP